MPEVLVLQHVRCETLGTIADALDAVGISARYVRAFEGEPVPNGMGDAAGLVVMGGPMGVYDHPRYPFLLDEMRLVERALRDEKPVLGVCLGSQLLAAVLGAEVKKGNQKEIGWYPVRLTGEAASDPLWAGVASPFVAFHWHGDVFELPHGAVALACSELTQYQAFRYGRNAYAFLFHMEVTKEGVAGMVGAFPDELGETGVDGGDIMRAAEDHLPRLEVIGGLVFRRWAGHVR